MKAAVVTGRRRFEIRDVPKPEVRPGTLLLKVKRCAICGTDLEYVDSPQWEDQEGGLPFQTREAILGHEWVGEVVEIGEGVQGWEIGDRSVDARTSCGACYWCARRMPHLCIGGPTRVTRTAGSGWANMFGAMTEYVLRPARGRIKVPENVTDEEAALTEPLNVGLSPVYEAGIKAADSVAVIGAGHIGQLCMMAAKAAGAAPVIITDRIQSRLDKALELGADYALHADQGNVYEQILDITQAGADGVFVCVREADVLYESTLAARREGTVAIVGFPKPVALDPIYWLVKHLRVIGCDPGGTYNWEAMRLMQYKQVDCRKLVSTVMPLKDVSKAFDSLYAGENVLVMLEP